MLLPAWTAMSTKRGYKHVCVIVSGDLHEEAINGDIDLKLETMSFHRRRDWWLSTHTTIQKDLLVNAEGRYECPRDYCAKTYKEASSLQRHIRCVFPLPPKQNASFETAEFPTHFSRWSIVLEIDQICFKRTIPKKPNYKLLKLFTHFTCNFI